MLVVAASGVMAVGNDSPEGAILAPAVLSNLLNLVGELQVGLCADRGK